MDNLYTLNDETNQPVLEGDVQSITDAAFDMAKDGYYEWNIEPSNHSWSTIDWGD